MQNAVNIISVAPFPVATANRPYGVYRVPAAPKDGYAKYTVKDVNDWRTASGGKPIPMAIQARALAEDLIQGAEDRGVFVIDTDEPTPEQLAVARDQCRTYLLEKVEEGDADFRASGDVRMVSEHAKLGAQMFGIKKDWLLSPADLTMCPGCQAQVSQLAAKCVCGAILNYARAREFGLLSEAQERNAVAMGKLQPLIVDAIGIEDREPTKVTKPPVKR